MALASLEMRKKLEHQSIRDGLTGLFNRHFLQIALERELARATRRKGTLAVLMIDVDHAGNGSTISSVMLPAMLFLKRSPRSSVRASDLKTFVSLRRRRVHDYSPGHHS